MKIDTGSIIQVEIKEINLFVYLKYIDVRDLLDEVSYPFQFRIHKQFFKVPLLHGDELDFRDLLISPLHLTGFKELIKTKQWKIVGKQDLTDYDMVQHHYKMAWPPSLIVDIDDVKYWRVLVDINKVNVGQIVEYCRCEHLEYAENLGAAHLQLRIIIEYMKENKRKLKIKEGWNQFDRILYNRYINMPLFSKIPVDFRGRLLPENN